MFVGILLRDSARDFNVEIESSRHREIFEISSRAVQKTIGSHLKSTGLDDNSRREFLVIRFQVYFVFLSKFTTTISICYVL